MNIGMVSAMWVIFQVTGSLADFGQDLVFKNAERA